MKSTTKKRIKYGKTELPEGALDPKNHKAKITIWLDGDVLSKLREEASQIPGGKYQTLINDILRKHTEGGGTVSLEKRLERIERQLFKGKAG